MINLQWGAVSNENITVAVTNAIGESVFTSEIMKYNGSVIPVDLGKQANGVYLVKIQSADKTINQKIVLNK